MASARVIVTYQLKGEDECRTETAARIAVDSGGQLSLYDERRRLIASLALAGLQTFALRSNSVKQKETAKSGVRTGLGRLSILPA